MTAQSHLAHTPPDRQAVGSRTGWCSLLATCAWATLLATALLQAGGRFIGFPSLVVLDLAMIAGLFLLRRHQRAGIVVIGAFCLLNNLHASLFAAVLQHPADFLLFLTCLTTWVTSVLALPVAFLAWRVPASTTTRRVPRLITITLAVALLLAAAGSLTLYATRTNEPPRSGDLLLVRERPNLGLLTETSGYEWSSTTLEAPAGAITVAVTSPDSLVGSTFTIEELDVDAHIPPDTTRRITFDAPAGTYVYRDAASLVAGILTVS